MSSDQDDNEIESVQEIDEALTAEEESEQAREDDFYGYQQNRRQKAPAGERRDATQLWLISYSDFITILFVFFLAMFAYATMEKRDLENRVGASISYEAFSKLMAKIQGDLGKDFVVKEDSRKITMQLGEKILFDSGSADLKPSASNTLAEMAKSIKLVAGDVIVEGHTDDVPIARGRYKSNWELSAARAFTVIQKFTNDGVPAQRLGAWGFGQTRPIAPNNKEDTRRQNRRIEIVVFKQGQQGETAHGG